MNRRKFAERIAAGLAGWYQQLAAQDLDHGVGEDAARIELIRLIGAQGSYLPRKSQRPVNWPADSRQRLDVAVLGRSTNATGWYGAIELKWPGSSVAIEQVRTSTTQDVMRVAFADTDLANKRITRHAGVGAY